MVKWEELCKSKEHGGIGFHQLVIFHEALMDRQIIKALKFLDSTWTVTTNLKYKHEWNVWKIKNVSKCSQSWNAYAKVSDIVHDGLRWEIGVGRRVSVLDNPQLDTFPLIYTPHLIYNQELLQGKLVGFLNRELLLKFFHVELVERIMKIRIRGKFFGDILLQNWQPHETVSTKKLYEAVRICHDGRCLDKFASKWVWQMPISSRIRV